MSKRLIISHGDCDGICSAAIALMKYPGANLSFAQPFTIVEDIRRAIKTYGKPNLLVMLDIAYSKGLKMELDRMKDVEVTFIDHHPSSSEISGANITATVNTKMSTSQLAASYFGISTRLAEIGAIGDKVLMVSKLEPLLNEAELIRKSLSYDVMDDDFRNFLCRELVKGKMPSEIDDVVRRAMIMERVLQESIETAKKNIIFENDRVIVIKYPGDIYGHAGTTASRIAIEKRRVVLLMFKVQNQPDMWMITARTHRGINVDLNKIMKKLNGGGHKYAAAGRVPVGKEEMVMMVAEDL
jgi:RecJ-like exonuclease